MQVAVAFADSIVVWLDIDARAQKIDNSLIYCAAHK